ncbi:MAG: isochorismatase family protein [Ilumatobacteraceae bacterium]
MEDADLPAELLDRWFSAFRAVQAWEAWQAHGAWVSAHPHALGLDVATRFAQASHVSDSDASAAREVVADARARLTELLLGAVLALPSTSGPAHVCFDRSRSALVVVDLQNDFCSPGGWLAGIGVDVSVLRAAIGYVATLLPHARDAGVPIIWLNWGNRCDQANIPPGVAHAHDPNGSGEGIRAALPDTDSRVLSKGSWGQR